MSNEIEMMHLREVLDYMPCVICEERIPEDERKYFCTICRRINRVVTSEYVTPRWSYKEGEIEAIEGREIEELKPKVKVIMEEKEEEPIEEIEILEPGDIEEGEIEIEEDLPEWEAVEEEPYRHGEYTLYTKEVVLRGNRKQKIYFFSKKKPENAKPVPLPAGYEVKVNEKGLPFLKKK